MNNNISIVIPIYNEEQILYERILFLTNEIHNHYNNYEIILSENGSADKTKQIALEIENKIKYVKALIDEGPADYGNAIRNGIRIAKYDLVAILELDYLDIGFLNKGYKMLGEFDLIIGSKKISPGIDKRSYERKLFTNFYNYMLKILFKLKITETHGLKIMRKSAIIHVLNNCVTNHAVLPSEFVIRASRDSKIRIIELPLTQLLIEIRSTRINAFKRMRKTFTDLIHLRNVLSD